jgi:hypothetical protein
MRFAERELRENLIEFIWRSARDEGASDRIEI